MFGNFRDSSYLCDDITKISFLTSLAFLRHRKFSFKVTRQEIRLNGLLSRRIVLLGAPIALQDALINISFLLITVIVNQMGVIASAALGVVEKIITFAMLPPVAISSAVAAMTAQDFGAGLTDQNLTDIAERFSLFYLTYDSEEQKG